MEGKECNLSNQSSPVRVHTKSAVIVKNQLVLLKFSFIFVCRCKWILDVATAVMFTGKLARRLGNSWVLGRLRVRNKNLHMTSFIACHE